MTADATQESSQTKTAGTAEPSHLVQRYIWFIIGVAINSFGIAFITKAALGTSPVSSIPYVLDLALPLSFGETTFILNSVYVLLQIVLLRRDFKPVQLLQLVANLVFSALIDVSMALLSWLNPTGIIAQLVSLLVGCCILSFGIAVEVAPNVIVVPGEGIVRAVSAVTGKPFGSCKVAFDVTASCVAVVLSFIFFGRLNGLGIGTIVSALLVGRICNFVNLHVPLIAHIARLTRRPSGAPEEAL